jgi:hypothetical protein
MKVYVWGTGRLVGKVIGVWVNQDDIVAYIDNDPNKINYMGKKVIKPIEVLDLEYDAILVINLYSLEIKEQCEKIGIDINKVIFLYNNCNSYDINRDYNFVKKVLGEKYSEIVRRRYHIIRETEGTDSVFEGGYYETDFVRTKTFELVVKEIKKRNLPGSVAEVGVFRGEFAQFINSAFPNKKCYLFDTFDGFNAREALKEKKRGNCSEAFIEAYKHTDLGLVLGRMTNIGMVEIKQGYFPESLNGMEDNFSFVSIDVDFEQSIYKSLEYFYPRLNEGGYIFIHDYNSSLAGVEKAVDDFELCYGIKLCKVPICDANGTLIITK